ncbi:hypothetical protein [Gloeobacter morelensis]|uniref:Uncharacterized protein n=1 Tax=Gloeobacter morelensis MG652769 TaxID=2781736 RepID=A0ABY3PU07_9CYAN|nr:hypothetical protein [Gloeobacter morelensis]UFP97107.1 hypothetical protein ISF26_14215 [Gloeobacter morelensis MG652769]
MSLVSLGSALFLACVIQALLMAALWEGRRCPAVVLGNSQQSYHVAQ